jgi:EAL domain-containing protein (putative c-di-GMP-specific phosphodiesterase class I)
MLVDDDVQITRMIRRVAEQVGFAVTEINDPLQFEEAYQSTPVSLIILDLNMPGKDGIELLDYLADQNCKARVMFISGVDKRVLGTTEQLAISRGLDFAGVLAKPIDIGRLRQTFDDHAKLHGVPSIGELDHALDSEQIGVAYQAKIDLGTGRVCGAEALARWSHPVTGPVSPEVFVGIAESSGRIHKLTQVVLDRALRAARDWKSIVPDLHLAVNLSPQLLSDLSLPDRLVKTMQSLEFEPERLMLEVTERGVMEDVNRSMAVLSRLRLKGVGLSIDDFGTGSSSLVQLYRMPFGEIKIDKSFVIDMLEHREAEVIVNSIVQLGKSMELNVVAEGVEDLATLERLKTMGCDQAQGYFISRPLFEPDFSNWLREHTQKAD